MAKDFYEVLGVPRGATQAQIKQAYRKLARRHHPDVNPGDKAAERRFKEISGAYHVLGDTARRKQYDQFGSFDSGAPAGGGEPRSRAGGFSFSGFDFESAGGGAGFKDVFQEIFGRRRKARAPKEPLRGGDLQYIVNLSFVDALRGIEAEVPVTRHVACEACQGRGRVLTGGTRTCPACGGSGRQTIRAEAMQFESPCNTCGGTGVFSGEPCRACRGEGTVPRKETIKVRIPAGVDNGSRVRVPGKGNEGSAGGPAGDLYILTNVSPHTIFKRKGDNIYVTVPITAAEAALGAKIEVPTIDGSATIRIPPSTQSGQRFRLRSRGAKSIRGETRGDQYVEAVIVMPKVVDEETKELYRTIQRHERWNPRSELFRNL